MSPFDAIKIEFGTLAELGVLMGLRVNVVYQWTKRGHIPTRHLKKIGELSEGRLTPEILRPDLFGDK